MHMSRHDAVGIEIGAETQATYEIDVQDPASAMARFQHTLRYCRDGMDIRAVGEVTLRASVDAFLPQGQVKVFRDGHCIAEKSWSETIRRRYS